MFNAKKWIDALDRWMIAITFAEAGQREMALNVLNEKPKKKRVVTRARKHVEQRPVLRM
jgi:predicted ATPase